VSRLPFRLAARGLTAFGLLAAGLFGVSGRSDWSSAWAVLAIFAAFYIPFSIHFSRTDPDLLIERMRRPPNAPTWDRVVLRIYPLLALWLLVTAALDAGHNATSSVPAGLQVAGAAAMLAAFVVVWWCFATNQYLASFARLQTDRGQRVVDAGPYALIRHPLYAANIALYFAMALLLGSWRALVPAAAMALLMGVRTCLEDRMLQNGLAGYREYATRVRYRLIPGIW
jgi:protein-S-isoprenylcysteine O-methyltransferase Ste14